MKTFSQSKIWHKGLLITALCIIGSINTVSAQKAGDVNKGARDWANTCARCHNIRNASEFRDDMWQPIVNHMRIRAGIPGTMARDILAFLQASNFATGNPGTVATSGLSGKEIFSNTCVACHGVDGKGALTGVPDLHERLSQSSDELALRRIIEGYQSPGSTMAMPPRGGTSLSDADLQKVLSYLRREFN